MGIFERLEERLERIETALAELADRPEPTPVQDTGPRWLDPRQAAEYVGMSHQSLALYRSKGDGGPAFSKVGNTVRYAREDLDGWLNERKRG
jgi:hypothetical protein